MKKIYIAMALALSLAPNLSARTLSVDEAKSNAAGFLSSGRRMAPALNGGLTLAGTITDTAGAPALFLFTGARGQGLVVTSASSEAMPVLGYADAGEFDFNAMPPAMRAWLEEYAAQIEQIEAGRTFSVAAPAPAERQAITPLCKTQWNQNAPYNDLTPELDGQHCMTGCVATAMAQTMKVFEWPAEHGEGFTSYTWQAGGTNLSYNLANSTIDWKNMLDRYGNDATDEQRLAVATLMRDCGYATSMQYSLTASGTTAITIPSALYYNFGYDKNVHTLQRTYFTLGDWENIVYTELSNGRPVILTGVSSSQGGHCFVCDGYSSDRYYHINWGWGGMSDGYFLLSAMTPETQGIGGSTGGFNSGVNACVGIQKPVEGSEIYTEILGDGDFNTGAQSYASSQNVTFMADAFYNSAMETERLYMGVKLTDASGNVTYVRGSRSFKFDSYQMTKQYNVAGSEFPAEGTYTVTAAWFNTETEKWDDVRFPIDKISKLTLTCADGTLNFAQVPIEANLTVKDVKILTTLYNSAKFKASAELVNDGNTEYLGEIIAVLLDSNDAIKAQTSPFTVDVEGKSTQPLEFVTSFTPGPPAGTYTFCFMTPDGKIISEPVPVEVKQLSGATSVSLADLKLTSGNDDSTPVVPSNDVSVAGKLRCDNGYFADTISCYVFPRRGGNSLASIGAETFFLSAGESQDFAFHGSFGNGVVGQTYMIGFFNNQSQINGVLYFVLGDENTGISMVESPEDVKLAIVGDMLSVQGAESAILNIYSAQGACIYSGRSLSASLAGLQPGTYVAMAETNRGPVLLKFIR